MICRYIHFHLWLFVVVVLILETTAANRGVTKKGSELIRLPHSRILQTTPTRVFSRNTASGQGDVPLLASSFLDGFNNRATYDIFFVRKLSIELCVGFITQTLAEVSKRGASSFAEVNLIAADLIQGVLSSFFSVYLSAPTASVIAQPSSRSVAISKRSSSSVEAYFSRCPDNAFQRCSPGVESYTILERGGALLKQAPGMFLTGCGGMAIGSIVTQSSADINALLLTSFATGMYVAVSTNFRYQVVAGVFEDRIIDPLFLKMFPYKRLHLLSVFILRTTNTYLGSALLVDYLHAINALTLS